VHHIFYILIKAKINIFISELHSKPHKRTYFVILLWRPRHSFLRAVASSFSASRLSEYPAVHQSTLCDMHRPSMFVCLCVAFTWQKKEEEMTPFTRFIEQFNTNTHLRTQRKIRRMRNIQMGNKKTHVAHAKVKRLTDNTSETVCLAGGRPEAVQQHTETSDNNAGERVSLSKYPPPLPPVISIRFGCI